VRQDRDDYIELPVRERELVSVGAHEPRMIAGVLSGDCELIV
jgi:hypothetical protein